MRVGIFGNEGSWYVADLQRAGEEIGLQSARLDFRRLSVSIIGETRRFCCGEWDLSEFEAFIVRTMPPGSLEQVVGRMDVLGRLASAGKTVINSPRAVECAVDKALTSMRLSEAGLPVPATWVGETSEEAMAAFDRLGGDVVVKPLFGAEGRGMLRVSDRDLAFRTFRTLERIDAVLYLQQFIEHPGFDVRAMVLNGRILGAIRRLGAGGFRTNISAGGQAEACTLTDEQEHLAVRAAETIGTDIAGVDLLSDASGKTFVIELNAVPGWKAFRSATGIDVAAEMLRHVCAVSANGRG